MDTKFEFDLLVRTLAARKSRGLYAPPGLTRDEWVGFLMAIEGQMPWDIDPDVTRSVVARWREAVNPELVANPDQLQLQILGLWPPRGVAVAAQPNVTF